jgi:hypothetical protein
VRINVPSSPVFPAPDTLPVRGVDGSRVVQPVNNETQAGNREPPAPPPEARIYRRVPGEPGFLEQRAMARRDIERRREQRVVLLDTRSGDERRRWSRREDDEIPRSVDIRV